MMIIYLFIFLEVGENDDMLHIFFLLELFILKVANFLKQDLCSRKKEHVKDSKRSVKLKRTVFFPLTSLLF